MKGSQPVGGPKGCGGAAARGRRSTPHTAHTPIIVFRFPIFFGVGISRLSERPDVGAGAAK